MKTKLTLFALLVFAIAMQAQNCQALFSSYEDSTGVVYFTDQSTSQNGSIIAWDWSFTDGIPSTSSVQNPTVLWNTSGAYSVCLTVYTSDSCSSTYCDSIIVGNGNPCAGFYATHQVTQCSGAGVADGAVDIFIYGGTPPYGYIWDNGATTEDIQGITPGYYCVTITDINGCTTTNCAYVDYNTPCNISLTYNVTQESPIGGNNGAIDITVTGGTAPYYYSWSNGASTEDVSGLSMGWYIVYISDSDSCFYNDTIYVPGDTTQNPCQMYLSGSVTNVSTIGGNDGAIDLTVNGGTPPYTYLWHPTNSTTEDISGLSQGVYTVNVNDAQGCNSSMTFSVLDPTNPSQMDTLYAGVIDTCLNFVYDSVYIYNYYWIDSFTVSITWAITGQGQFDFVTVEYTVNQPGPYWAVLSINCGTKTVETFIDAIYLDYSIMTSTGEINDNNNIVLYPNPVKDVLNLDIGSNTNKLNDIQIYNSTGQIMRMKKSVTTPGINHISIDVKDFEKGMYIIIVHNKAMKFIKN